MRRRAAAAWPPDRVHRAQGGPCPRPSAGRRGRRTLLLRKACMAAARSHTLFAFSRFHTATSTVHDDPTTFLLRSRTRARSQLARVFHPRAATMTSREPMNLRFMVGRPPCLLPPARGRCGPAAAPATNRCVAAGGPVEITQGAGQPHQLDPAPDHRVRRRSRHGRRAPRLPAGRADDPRPRPVQVGQSGGGDRAAEVGGGGGRRTARAR